MHAAPQTPVAREIHGRILLAEDDYELRRLIASNLRRIGCDVVEACDGSELIERVGASLRQDLLLGFDLVISDVRMPGWSGLEILEGMRSVGCRTPVILITAFGDEDIHRAAGHAGAVAVFDKPFDIAELDAAVRDLLA